MRSGILYKLLAPDIGSGRLCRAPHVLATAQGDEVVLFDTARERYYTLNAVGTRVWELLAEPTTLASLAAAIRREFAVPADGADDPVEGDLTRLLRELRSAGMLRVERMPRGAQ